MGGQHDRGCVFFNFGTGAALQLLVSVWSLRRHHSGPVTVLLQRDRDADALARDLARLDVETRFVDGLSRSGDRHRVFLGSPYATTLSFDSDILFKGPIDGLWAPLEREGVLVTRFSAPPYGVGGTRDRPGEMCRVDHLAAVAGLIGPELHEQALRRMLDDGIDLNIGVIGISRPRGDAFLADWAAALERGRGRDIAIMDEMLVVGLVNRHPHWVAEERWNCPADAPFRTTSLDEAAAIHFFADGHLLDGRVRLGRNRHSEAGQMWYDAWREAGRALDLARWRRLDRRFDRHAEGLFAHGPAFALKLLLRERRERRRRARSA